MIDPRFLELLRAHLRYLDADTALSSEADLRALGLDSMEAVNLMLDIEDEFAVVLPDSALTAATFGSAEALWAAVADAGAARTRRHPARDRSRRATPRMNVSTSSATSSARSCMR